MIAVRGRDPLFRRILFWSAAAAVTIVAVWIASLVPNADWYVQYDPAARGLLHGLSPYTPRTFANPPWTALVLVPFVILPRELARGLVLVCTVAAWLYVAWRLRAPRLAVIAMMLSPTAIAALLAANVDAFVMLGALLPPAWGLLALTLKPQVGLGAAVYDLFAAWREHKVAGVLRTFAPVALVAVASALLFPVWIDRMLELPSNGWNRSLFPYGIPLGLALLWLGIRRRNIFLAMASTPFMAPYLTFPSYLVVQVGLLHEDVEHLIRRDVLQVVLCIFLWVIMLAFRL
jgi:hypothetical protein